MKTVISILFFIVVIGISLGKARTNDPRLTASPNPFVTTTYITIHDLEHDTASLAIYDLYGQLVVSYFKDLVLSGSFTLTFSADTLPDGGYLAVLTVNGMKKGEKLVKSATVSSFNDKQISNGSINVFPNPAVDRVSISTELDIKELQLHDLQGKKLEYINTAPFDHVDLAKLGKGIYLLQVKTGQGIYREKIIKW